jgi:hypothetical protein
MALADERGRGAQESTQTEKFMWEINTILMCGTP